MKDFIDSIEEAKKLQSKIAAALNAMKFHKEDYNENEVLFRLTAIKDMLIIAHNDACALVRFWSDE